MSDTRASHPVDKIVVIGGKGSAVVIAEQIYDNQQTVHDVELLGYAFDDPAFYPDIHGIPIVCKTREAWDKYRDDPSVKFVFALYRPDLIKERMALRDSYGIPLERYATFVHHSAYVAQSARMG